jgi:hypothetical protein
MRTAKYFSQSILFQKKKAFQKIQAYSKIRTKLFNVIQRYSSKELRVAYSKWANQTTRHNFFSMIKLPALLNKKLMDFELKTKSKYLNLLKQKLLSS